MSFRNTRSFLVIASLVLAGLAAFPATVLAAEEGSPWGIWLGLERKEIANGAEKDAQAEYQKLLVQAEQDAAKIVERSRQEIEGMTRTAQHELRLHAAELSVRLAEEKIQDEISDADHERLLNRFVSKLGGKS